MVKQRKTAEQKYIDQLELPESDANIRWLRKGTALRPADFERLSFHLAEQAKLGVEECSVEFVGGLTAYRRDYLLRGLAQDIRNICVKHNFLFLKKIKLTYYQSIEATAIDWLGDVRQFRPKLGKVGRLLLVFGPPEIVDL